ncbi:hypothetical protein BS78_K252000 [Paspalum vaginatum]|uniref:Uncharacterized protein n=1 Tax=Paspalum vaginatum TaxID=158149 RepID=A0A9W7X7C9_9POAL|nr:hypothetical protein BS78_K252000 [Paspalum vaginatum]
MPLLTMSPLQARVRMSPMSTIGVSVSHLNLALMAMPCHFVFSFRPPARRHHLRAAAALARPTCASVLPRHSMPCPTGAPTQCACLLRYQISRHCPSLAMIPQSSPASVSNAPQ